MKYVLIPIILSILLLTSPLYGTKYVGEWKNGKHHGQGTYTFHDGVKWEGVWRRSEPWNITKYDKDGKIYGRKVNGVKR